MGQAIGKFVARIVPLMLAFLVEYLLNTLDDVYGYGRAMIDGKWSMVEQDRWAIRRVNRRRFLTRLIPGFSVEGDDWKT